MKIDLERAQYYAGLGDIAMLAWLAEGAEAAGAPIVFHRTRNLDLIRLLGLRVDLEPGGLCLDPVFATEVADGCRRPRLEYIREFLGITTPLARPRLRLDAEDETWAEQRAAELGAPLVLLFPQAVWKPREWPPNYWVDLAWKLQAAGNAVLVLLQGDDARFHNTPNYQWGTPLARLAALIRRAALVIGNDSFPAHLAGTMGVPTLALLGPTLPTVFPPSSGIECLASTAIDCTGCHFREPFRAACDQGCMSLYRLFPDIVFQRSIDKLLGRVLQ
jgi:hypothetical protein